MLHCAYRGGQRGQSPHLNPIPPRSALALIALNVPIYLYQKRRTFCSLFEWTFIQILRGTKRRSFSRLFRSIVVGFHQGIFTQKIYVILFVFLDVYIQTNFARYENTYFLTVFLEYIYTDFTRYKNSRLFRHIYMPRYIYTFF